MGAAGRQASDLVIDTGKGPDAVSIRRVQLPGAISVSAKDSVDVSVHRSKGSTLNVNVENSESDPKDPTELPASSVVIRNTDLTQNVKVSADGPVVVKSSKVTINYPDVLQSSGASCTDCSLWELEHLQSYIGVGPNQSNPSV